MPITTNVVSSNHAQAMCTRYNIKVCQWLSEDWWFSPGTPVSSTNKTDCHYITEILLKMAYNTLTLTLIYCTLHHVVWILNVILKCEWHRSYVIFILHSEWWMLSIVCYVYLHAKQKFEDTNSVIRSRNWKDRQHNGQ